MSDVGDGLEARGTETVQARAGCCVGEAGGQCRGAQLVGGLAVGNLMTSALAVYFFLGDIVTGFRGPHISKADILHETGVDVAPFAHFVEERERDVFQTAVFQTALPRLR